MSLPLFDSPVLVAAKPPHLRPYQQKAIDEARMHFESGKKRILLSGPCGSGKMVQIAAMIRSSTVPALFVAHRMELVSQCVSELTRQGISNIGVLRGTDDRYNPSASVQVASIQTLMRRDKPKAGLVFIDEAHRSLSDSYVEHVFGHYQDAILIGLTASPCRTDGRPLGSLFEVLVVFATYSELFKRPDWLVEPDGFSSPVDLSTELAQVPISHGDYQETALGEVMSQKSLVGHMLEHWLRLSGRHPVVADGKPIPGKFTEGDRRRTFIFATNIKHSLEICERFSKAGVRIAHLDGTTPEDQRRAMLADLRAGKLECVSNVNVLLEGVDIPEVKCVVHGRPTYSLILHLQSFGRIFRPWNNVRPLILDHAGNWDRHGPPHEDRIWSLEHAAERSRLSRVAPMKICKACFAYCALGCHLCPYCAAPFTAAEMRTPHETTVELQQRSTDPEVVRKEFFDKLAIRVRARGYKPGFAAFRFKEHYGAWPPYAWTDALKASFASDPDWQERVLARVKAKEEEDREWGKTGEMGPEDMKTLEATAVFDEKERSLWDPRTVEKLRLQERDNFATYDDGEETFAHWADRTTRR